MKPSPYAGFDPMSQSEMWEDRTRELVLSRVHDVPALTFFSAEEAQVLDAIVDRLIPQEDRTMGEKVPITPWIDRMLAEDDTDGFRKADMPWDQDVWRLALAGVEQTSHARYQRSFVGLRPPEQDAVLSALQDGTADGDVWQRLKAHAVFEKVMQEVASIYYAHPAAWSEIGWPGPASKRGYMRTGYGLRDPWQPREASPLSSVPLVEARGTGGGSPSGSGGATH
jgi:hypothetical protein